MTRLGLLLPILLGAVAATGFAPLDLWPLMLVAIAWWLKLVHDARSIHHAMGAGWLFGLGHFTVNNNWIQHAFDFQDKMPPALGYFAVVGLALYLAIYPALAAGLAWRLASPRSAKDATSAPGAAFVLVAAAAWIVTEWLRATMFTGYAWDPLGVAWLPVPDVALAARWIGTYAMSGVMVLTAGALLLLASKRWRLAAVLAGLFVAVIFANITMVPPSEPLPPDAPRVRVVQPNIGQEEERSATRTARKLGVLTRLSGRPGPAPRLIVWPEGAIEAFVEDGYPREWYYRADPRQTRATIASVLGPRDVALAGGTSLEFGANNDLIGAGNTIFTVRSDASLGDGYDKAHLVPYGEYLPMRGLLEPLGLSRLVAGEVDFISGPGPRTLDVPVFGPVGMQICYEIIFSGHVVDRAHRPRLIFNPSNDAWFGSWGPWQHLAQARMRAIEEGLPVVRSTPNGISAIIAADGRVLAHIPRHVAGAIELPIPPAEPPTPFSQWGNWLAGLVVLLLLGLAVVVRRR